MATLDILLLLCFIPALIRGLTKGFVEQVVALISLLVGAWLAYKISPHVSVWLSQWLTVEPKILTVISFIIVVAVAVVAMDLIGKLLTKTLSIAALGWLNRLLGVAFSLLTAALVMGILIFAFDNLNNSWGLVKSDILNDSIIYTTLRDIALKVFPYLKDFVETTVQIIKDAQ